MTVLRWVLIVPVAIISLMIGSLAGGTIFSLWGLLGQGVADTGSAFAGSFAFVFACGLIAPSHKRTIGLVAASFICILAFGTVILSNFTNIEEFVRLSARERVVSPVAQVLGTLYAIFIGLPFLSAETVLDDLWRETRALGLLVFSFGVLLTIVGFGFALTRYGWLGVETGIGVVLVSVVTWISPFIHLSIRMNYMRRNIRDTIDTSSL